MAPQDLIGCFWDSRQTPVADPQIRAFIALPLPARVRNALCRIQNRVGNLPGVKASLPPQSNLHLTLVFLGNISHHQLKPIAGAMDRAASQVTNLSLSLSAPGTFPGKSRSPRIFWAGVSGNLTELKRLFDTLALELLTEGLAFDRQKFSPHITLARFKNIPRHSHISEILSHHNLRSAPFPVSRIDLYKSQLKSPSAVYTLLHTSSLRPADL